MILGPVAKSHDTPWATLSNGVFENHYSSLSIASKQDQLKDLQPSLSAYQLAWYFYRNHLHYHWIIMIIIIKIMTRAAQDSDLQKIQENSSLSFTWTLNCCTRDHHEESLENPILDFVKHLNV